MSTLHKALLVESKFAPFSIGDRCLPEPQSGQLLVRIEAVALNPIDWKAQEYGLYLKDSQYPAVLGSDAAGVVQKLGSQVSGFSVGDGVVFPASWLDGHGAFQQFTLADAAITAKVPRQVSLEEASTIPVALAAAVVGLYLPNPYGAAITAPFDKAGRGRYPGRPIVVLGGATSVGQYASSKHAEYLTSLGATHVLDRNISPEDLTTRITEIATSSPIDLVYDAVSSLETQNMGYGLLTEKGQLIVTLEPAVRKEEEGKIIIRVIGVFTLPFSRELGIQLYGTLTDLLNQGLIKPNRLEVISGGLGSIVRGLERLKANLISGHKVVVRPQENA
ncbi:hypothetical protein H0H87_005959 [Tephrocybe sp. NHM501043]|nr:hypothetical protein H0H87_005959 [Tephrocybe sp. NHM501043]